MRFPLDSHSKPIIPPFWGAYGRQWHPAPRWEQSLHRRSIGRKSCDQTVRYIFHYYSVYIYRYCIKLDTYNLCMYGMVWHGMVCMECMYGMYVWNVCIYVSMYLSIYVCIYVSMYLCMNECMYEWMYVCVCMCVYVCVFVCMYVYACVCMYVCTYVHVRTYVCMYACNEVMYGMVWYGTVRYGMYVRYVCKVCM